MLLTGFEEPLECKSAHGTGGDLPAVWRSRQERHLGRKALVKTTGSSLIGEGEVKVIELDKHHSCSLLHQTCVWQITISRFLKKMGVVLEVNVVVIESGQDLTWNV